MHQQLFVLLNRRQPRFRDVANGRAQPDDPARVGRTRLEAPGARAYVVPSVRLTVAIIDPPLPTAAWPENVLFHIQHADARRAIQLVPGEDVEIAVRA